MGYKVPVLEYYEWQKAVRDKDISSPPDSPAAGDRYIIGYNPSGAWYNKPKRLAEYNGTDWDIVEPKEGMLTLVQDEGLLYHYIQNKWRDFAQLVGKKRVEAITGNKSLSIDDANKVFACDTTSACTYTLPSVSASEIGIQFTFGRTGIGRLTIQAADNDMIAESSPGGTIYSDVPTQRYTTLTVLLLAYNQWVITSGHGTWVTT